MEPERKRLFIYDRKEVGVLILLGVGVSLFAFTLGVHLGKQVIPASHEAVEEEKPVAAIEAEKTLAPNRTEVAEQVKNAADASKEALSESLRNEVAKTGLQIDHPKPLSLPEKTRGEKKAETAAQASTTALALAVTETPAAHENAAPAAEPASPVAHEDLKTLSHAPTDAAEGVPTLRYSLQVGSFPSMADARPRLTELNQIGLPAEVKEVDLKGKGRWFRVVIGHFATVAEAEKTGKSYQQEKRIKEFVVVNLPAP